MKICKDKLETSAEKVAVEWRLIIVTNSKFSINLSVNSVNIA